MFKRNVKFVHNIYELAFSNSLTVCVQQTKPHIWLLHSHKHGFVCTAFAHIRFTRIEYTIKHGCHCDCVGERVAVIAHNGMRQHTHTHERTHANAYLAFHVTGPKCFHTAIYVCVILPYEFRLTTILIGW